MLTRKAIALTGLVFAVAVLSPAAALAGKGGTNRPIKIHQSGTTEFTPGLPGVPPPFGGGTLHAETTGNASHLGKTTSTFDGTLTFTDALGGFTVVGPITAVAANGAELSGELTGTGVQTATGSEIDAKITITAGTKRFDDASGTLNGTISNVATANPGLFDSESSFKGRISY